MSRSLLLGGRAYIPLSDLGSPGRGCAWRLVRAEEGGDALLLQHWSPRPSDRELDKLRETYLQRFLDAEPLDPLSCRFGFDAEGAWFLQALPGREIGESWPECSPSYRGAFLAHLKGLLRESRHPRFLDPVVLRLQSGRLVIPRVLGEAPFGLEDLQRALDALGGPGSQEGERFWEEPPGISEDVAHPIRGRSQELTYLKSLVLGLNAPGPLERILVLMGEEGVGKDFLADWAAAAVETEGLWVASFEVEHQEGAGGFFARMLQELLRGLEADFYAHHAEASRVLARRLSTFAFLRGGRKTSNEEARLEGEEIEAALRVLAFVGEQHPRMLFVRDADRGDEELQRLLSALALGSSLPWFFTVTSRPSGLRHFLGPLKGEPAASFMTLNRLEDAGILEVISDLLGPHGLPEAFLQGLLQASLGNVGLLRGILEKAQQDGTLVWGRGGWALAEGSPGTIQVHDDLVAQILAGRLQRIGPAGLAIARALALVERPLAQRTLGMALGIAGDPLDEALRVVVSARMVHVKEGRVALADPRLGPLALAGSSPSETRRLAKALLRALQEEAGRPVLAVRLQFLASDEKTALALVMQAIEQDPPPPQEAELVVQQTLPFHPSPAQRARLWEFLADAWAQGVPGEGLGKPSPSELALDTLDLAEAALGECAQRDEAFRVQLARVLRKRAFLCLRLRNVPPAMQAIQAAAEALTGMPRHREQARLRLALGRAHLLEGFQAKGVKALEEGLQILGAEALGNEPGDRVAILMELGRVQGQRCQFQRALGTLQAAQRLLERGQDPGQQVELLGTLARVRFAQGQPDAAYDHLREALHLARILDDPERQAECHLLIGSLRSLEQSLAPALHHLEGAIQRFNALGDAVGSARARVWKARTLAALGETVGAEMELLNALSMPPGRLTAAERGDFAFLQGEISVFRGGLGDAIRLFGLAAELFEGAGLVWWERLARLCRIQAEASSVRGKGTPGSLEGSWAVLEQMKAQIEGSGSRWLEMEWHRAHALLLMAAPEPTEAVASEALSAWSEAQAAARELRLPSVALEASAQSAALLIKRSEKLGARSRLQDAYGTFQDLWSRIPEEHAMAFLGRPDIHRFQQAVEEAGLRFVLPERVDPLADWTPTLVNLPLASC